MTTRPYDRVLTGVCFNPDDNRARRMRVLVDRLWDELHPTGVSWIGFYVYEGGDELVLGPMRNKPACSPIGLHGVCGRSFTQRQTIVVRDVRDLGESYVACDPRDRAEVVVPCVDERGACWGVLDADSHAVGAFDEHDAAALRALLVQAGLTFGGLAGR
ncbi:MAG: GAF domain-containing protein [Phycisphaerae bacterium]